MLTSSVPAAFAATSIVDGDLVKASGSSAVYLVKGSTLRTFPYSTIYHSWGFPSNYSTVKTVAAADLAGYTVGDPVPFRDGSCFRGTAKSLPGFESQAVFCVSDGQLRPVESQNAFFGLFNVTNWTQGNKYVQYIPDDFLSKFDFAFGNKVSETEVNAGSLMNGMVVKGSVDGAYYLVQDGKLRSISTAAATANKIDLSKAVVTAQTKINAISSALPVSTTTELSLVTPKTKAEAGSTTTDVTKAAKLVVSADKTSVEADGATKVTVTAKVATNEGATVSTATNSVTFAITSGTGTLSATTVAAVNGVATVVLTPSTVASSIVVSASATGLTAGNVTVTATANTFAPQVTSVSNQGMRIINVSFDKTLDKISAETPTNYVPKNNKSAEYTPTAAKLLADGKTVQLFLPSGFWNDSTVDSIEVKNIQNAAQTATIATVTKEFTMSDSSVPTVVAVEALGSKAIRVTFSEAVDNGIFTGATVVNGTTTAGTMSAFRLDDKELLTATTGLTTSQIGGVSVTYPDAGDYTKALISFANPVSVGAHTLTVSYGGAIKDYNVVSTSTSSNAYTMQPAGYVATVSANTNVPQLSSVEILTQTKARYTFSKPVTVTSVSTAFFYNTAANATTGTSTTLANITKVSDTVYEVAWDSAISTGNVYFYVGAGVSDYSGNTISPLPSSKLLVVSSDTAPVISSVSMKTDSDKVVDVYFNKDVETSSATSAVNYVFKKSDGTILTSTNGGSAIGSNGNPSGTIAKYVDGSTTNNKRIQITLGDGTSSTYALPGGTYQLCVTGVKASSGSTSSAMSTSCYSFTATDKTRPTLSSYAATSKRIVLTFSEAMDPATAGNTEYYKYTLGSTTKKLSEISASVTTGNSGKDVIITIADGSSNSFVNGGVLSVGYIDGSTKYEVRDANLNILQKVGDDTSSIVTQTLAVATDTNINLATGSGRVTALKVKSTTTLEATFATKLETISASEFKIKHGVGTATIAANITNAEICKVISTNCKEVDETKVIFTIANDSATRFSVNTDAVELYTTAISLNTISSTRNVMNLTLKDNVVEGANTTRVITGANDIQPVLKSFTLNSDGKGLILSFDGKINISNTTYANNLANDLIISQVSGSNTTTLTGTSLTITPSATASSLVAVGFTTATLSTLDTVTVKTVSQDSIDAVGANGAKILANAGMQTAGFVVSSLVEGLTATGIGYGQTIAITFNKDLDRNSVYSTWYNISGNTYVSGSSTDSKISGAVSFNANTNKVLVNGVGEFEIPSLQIGGADTLSTNLDAEYTYADRVLTIKIISTPTAANTITYTVGDTMTYTPASAIKTSLGTGIETGYTSFTPLN
ncbi:MAG: hypothetical protein QMB51_02715 [Patescibacteria group bacterium]